MSELRSRGTVYAALDQEKITMFEFLIAYFHPHPPLETAGFANLRSIENIELGL
jgi:hypothetical protein